ncbi:MAG: tyrosine-type recombinase/integrase, partial [Lachnospiraceae bacterium]|nr:tyrosine-type recombinase/integrase [Lachnospiraceae bacterium]
ERTFPVFIKENGEYRGSDTIKYASKVINYELGIHFNFHALRHTHATMLIEAGVPVKAVSDRLGHGNVRTTLETYVHVTEKMKNEAVDKFEAMGSLDEQATIISFNDLKRKVSTKSS